MKGYNALLNFRGYTLLESLLALLVLAILTSIAIPSYENFILSVEKRNAINALRQSLYYAKVQALTLNKTVRLCASSDGQACNASGNWHDGWIIYQDLYSSTAREKTDPLLKIQNGFKHLTISKNGRFNTIKISKTGRIGLNRSFYICLKKEQTPIVRLSFLHSGRVRMDTKDIKC